MIQLKGCPKCMGDIMMDRDLFGEFIKCLQCGLMKDADAWDRAEELAPVPAENLEVA